MQLSWNLADCFSKGRLDVTRLYVASCAHEDARMPSDNTHLSTVLQTQSSGKVDFSVMVARLA